ncbi:hypothetical protein [Streptomyces aureus]|uniref:hypothetical protein n=1 Tax=Streptomyces aureus TaxID=193461 RepID=UPI0036408A80
MPDERHGHRVGAAVVLREGRTRSPPRSSGTAGAGWPLSRCPSGSGSSRRCRTRPGSAGPAGGPAPFRPVT